VKILSCSDMRRLLETVPVFLIVFLAAAYAPATRAETLPSEGKARKEKIQVSSESLVMNDTEKFAEFIGNVRVVQGDTEIVSNRLKIYYEGNPRKPSDDASAKEASAKDDTGGDSIKKIVATGNVKITFDDTVAHSREAVYTTSDRILVLSGPNSRVSKASSGEISGSKIVIDRESGQIKFEGNVEGVFFPGEKGLD